MENTERNMDLYEEIVFNNMQEALEAKERCESRLSRSKIALIIAAVAEVLWILDFIIGPTGVLANIMDTACFVGTIASYAVGGGILYTLKTNWRIAKKIGFWGWLVIPFPLDIFTGLVSMGVALIYGIFGTLLLPLLFVFLNHRRLTKELEAAKHYIV